MAYPASYTEYELAQYQQTIIAQMAGVLGWSVDESNQEPGDFQEPVNDALSLYDVSDITLATDIPLLRACAAVAVWKAVVGGLAALYDFSDGTPVLNLKRSQMQKMATEAFEMANREMLGLLPDDHPSRLGPGYNVSLLTLEFSDDPYSVPAD